ncbi:hypothetical protein OG984_06415 [Nocardioides sp. NBC_00368]|uniref:hypothetical protein n=1 Tax=Nocardioides sp. NBC_00368 TaxID=2976000 RepID=UPI002E1CFD54
MQRGIAVLIKAGWVAKRVEGIGREAKTTFFLMPGEAFRVERWERRMEAIEAGGLVLLSDVA